MTVAIYLRLSLEDDDLMDGKLESASIKNQRNMLMEYIRNSPDLCSADIVEYQDDGYSGKTFDRPGVEKLLAAARQGKIQCIIVKDISRFGRDYIIVGNYLTKVFPFLGIRFIALNDHFDSARKGDINSLDRAFQAMIYDMYSRDLSKKVKSAKQRLAERGVYINPVAPYGYRRDPKDKHKLLPDPDTAPTVRRIFELVAEGASTEAVTRRLNEEGVPPPSHAKAGTSSGHANWKNQYWNRHSVISIIRDRQYIGSTVFGKRVRPEIGVHQQWTTRPEDRIVVDDRHEALIPKELYDKAQEQLGGEYRYHGRHTAWDNPLSKKVYCGSCGYAIVRQGAKEHYYMCNRPKTVPAANCYQEKIYERDLLEMVIEAIRVQAHYAVELHHIQIACQEERGKLTTGLRNKIHSLETLQAKITEQSNSLYEELVNGKIDRDSFARQKAVLTARKKAARSAANDARQKIVNMDTEHSTFIEKYQCYTDLDELSAEIAAELIDRVSIWPDGRIEIRLNYLDEVSAMLDSFNYLPDVI